MAGQQPQGIMKMDKVLTVFTSDQRAMIEQVENETGIHTDEFRSFQKKICCCDFCVHVCVCVCVCACACMQTTSLPTSLAVKQYLVKTKFLSSASHHIPKISLCVTSDSS
jgi:hypothetical protein